MVSRLILALVGAVALGACVTPKVVEQPKSQIDFAAYRTVYFSVHALPGTEYGSGAEDMAYARSTIDLTNSALGAKLRSMGYTVASEPSAADFNIDVAVTAVKPGSAALRFWVSFGAGRAIYLFEATFTNRQGERLGRFEGGRSYTGLEMNQVAFASRDEIAMAAATRAVQQIQEFMGNKGAFAQTAASEAKPTSAGAVNQQDQRLALGAPANDQKEGRKDVYFELLKLEDLHKRGILTDAEFEAQKQKLLDLPP